MKVMLKMLCHYLRNQSLPGSIHDNSSHFCLSFSHVILWGTPQRGKLYLLLTACKTLQFKFCSHQKNSVMSQAESHALKPSCCYSSTSNENWTFSLNDCERKLNPGKHNPLLLWKRVIFKNIMQNQEVKLRIAQLLNSLSKLGTNRLCIKTYLAEIKQVGYLGSKDLQCVLQQCRALVIQGNGLVNNGPQNLQDSTTFQECTWLHDWLIS